jgi:hypothetical protein
MLKISDHGISESYPGTKVSFLNTHDVSVSTQHTTHTHAAHTAAHTAQHLFFRKRFFLFQSSNSFIVLAVLRHIAHTIRPFDIGTTIMNSSRPQKPNENPLAASQSQSRGGVKIQVGLEYCVLSLKKIITASVLVLQIAS